MKAQASSEAVRSGPKASSQLIPPEMARKSVLGVGSTRGRQLIWTLLVRDTCTETLGYIEMQDWLGFVARLRLSRQTNSHNVDRLLRLVTRIEQATWFYYLS